MLLPRREFDDLIQAIQDHAWQHCAEVCFKLLYCTTRDLSVEAARATVARYVTIFRERCPQVTWPEQILSNIPEWIEQYGRQIPDPPESSNMADGIWLFCFDALVLAVTESDDRKISTAACATAIVSAINARATNVWLADDPEAVRLWKAQRLPQHRTVSTNDAAEAIMKREWGFVAQWLTEHLLEEYLTVSVGDEEVQDALTHWKDNEMLLIMPCEDK
jgi:hypothetical protein